jgi:hypothetical protein
MSRAHFTNPEVLVSLRREYEQKVERDNAALDEFDLERQELHAEEVKWLDGTCCWWKKAR